MGDIGGTNCRLAIATLEGTQCHLSQARHYLNADYPGLAAILNEFLRDHPELSHARLAVAGPTDGQTVHFTNLDWDIDTRQLAQQTGLSHITLINDFVANGHALSGLSPEDTQTLQRGEAHSQGPRLIIGPGTGLGVAQCFMFDGRWFVQPSEGGHIAFAPATTQQQHLLRFMLDRHGRCSVERILSGPGLLDLYAFLSTNTAAQPQPEMPAEVESRARNGDPAALATLQLFWHILAQTAGDLALVSQATGGVFLAGGILPKWMDMLSAAEFCGAFAQKGRFTAWAKTVPIHLVQRGDLGLLGAALSS